MTDAQKDALIECRLGATAMLIVFDGVCNFCNGWVRFVLKHDRKQVFKFTAAQSSTGQRALQDIGSNLDDLDSILLVTSDQTYNKSEAIIRIVQEFGGMWRVSILLVLIPVKIRDWFYTQFGRRRYALFGKSDHCGVPSPGWKNRFVGMDEVNLQEVQHETQ